MRGFMFSSCVSPRRITTFLAAVCVAVGVMAAGSAQAATTITVIDGLGAAAPTTHFGLYDGTSGLSLFATQFVGPRFDLTQQTTLTEIGAFVNASDPSTAPADLPVDVTIVPAAANGSPDGSTVLASYSLSSDRDPFTFSYESVNPNLTLPSGTYFALFGVQEGFAFVLGGVSNPVEYRAGLIPTGFLNPTTGESASSAGEFMAARILGYPAPTAADLLATLAFKVVDVGPGTSLTDKIARAQLALNAGDFTNASEILAAFAREVEVQAGKTIPPNTAATLIDDASQICGLLA